VAHSAAILKQLDALHPTPASVAIEPEPPLPIEDFIEAEITRRRTIPVNRHASNGHSASAPITARACPHCHAAVQPDDRFCPKCGTSLALACVACGQSLQAGDRFCPRCGAQQTHPQPAL
jgi:RNA polymerase subunit RPABC4/transcription elongation factor Spt4